jgi:hypothetical protein
MGMYRKEPRYMNPRTMAVVGALLLMLAIPQNAKAG